MKQNMKAEGGRAHTHILWTCVLAVGCGQTCQGPLQAPIAGAELLLPCDVAQVVEHNCADCHGAVTRQGAPFSLTTPADFVAEGPDSISIGTRVLARIQDPARPMPPAPNPRLTADAIAALTAFVQDGALGVPDGCAVNDTSTGQGADGGSGGSARPDRNGAATGGDVGGTDVPGTMGTAQWPMFGHDLSNSRANAVERTLSTSSVPNLSRRWQFDGAATTSTPAVVGGVVYLPAWDGHVYALRLQDGTPIWDATLPNLIDSSPAVTDVHVYVSDNMGWVHALERENGALTWSVQVDTHAQAHLWSSPVYIEDANIVVVGVASGEEELSPPYTFRGSVVALNAETGTTVWRFVTAPDDGTSGPGIAVWASAAVDLERKALYIGTGNNYSAPAGPYADSMLAIDYTTGRLLWSHQFTMDDVFTTRQWAGGPDADVGSTANLFSADGRDLLGIGVKNGLYYALDRDSGASQWTTELTRGSALGGVISPSAYADGKVYVTSNRLLEGQSDIVALAAQDGEELWRTALPRVTYGGVAYANGVVYVGTESANIFALNAATGEILWRDTAPDSIAGGPAVVDGLLLVPWGYQWTLGRGSAGRGGLIAYGP